MPVQATGPAALLQLIAELEQESIVLASGQAAEVAELATRKSGLVQALTQCLRSLTPDQRLAYRALLERARDLNDRNAKILAARWLAHSARLDALAGACQPEATTYSAAGRKQALWHNTRGGGGLSV